MLSAEWGMRGLPRLGVVGSSDFGIVLVLVLDAEGSDIQRSGGKGNFQCSTFNVQWGNEAV
jgi:hypothetical protein